eukprot:TRINITY_DN13_c0_g1_i2.p1 TRINITY_DN13_c0_g1~~TRINITY_DN13_c0_g1_i2.p1  ORF type:complete len:576 (-),score=102.57 TRINITY_DN13_c0_g1_i2:3472-5199(-)
MPRPSDASLTTKLPCTAIREKGDSLKEHDASSPSTTIVVESVSAVRTRPPCIRFDSLPSDVVARIIHHALEHSQRGVPYYPPIKAPCLVPLALSSQPVRALVAFRCDSDLSYVDAVASAIEQNEEPLKAKQELVQFYRAQNGHLKKFNLHKKTTLSQRFRLQLTDIVLSTSPRLTQIDVSGMPRSGEYCAQLLHTVVQLLHVSSLSLQTLKMSFHNGNFVDMVNSLSFPNLTDVNLRITFGVSPKRVTQFFSQHGALLDTLTLFSAEDMADEVATHIVAACPNIKHLRFNGAMDPALSRSFLTLIRSYSHMQSVSLHNYLLDPELRNTLETHPAKPKVYLCRSIFSDLPHLVSDVPSFSKTLLKAETVICEGLEVMTALTRLENLEELHIRVESSILFRFGTALASLRKLKSLTVTCEALEQAEEVCRDVVDHDLVVALEAASNLRQVVIAHPPLSVRSLKRIMKCYGGRLEYLVAGIHCAAQSAMRNIIELVKWAMCHNANMKVLCFGLGLSYDCEAAQLYDELVRTIELAEVKLAKLNTYWLRLNAKTLLTFPAPGDELHGPHDDGEEVGNEG